MDRLLLHDSHNEVELNWTWLLSCPRRSETFCFKFIISASAAATSSRSALVYYQQKEKKKTSNGENHYLSQQPDSERVPWCLSLTGRTLVLFAYSLAQTPMKPSNFSPSAADPSNFQPIESTLFCCQKEKCMTYSEKTHPNTFRRMKYYMAVILHTEHFEHYFIAKLLI